MKKLLIVGFVLFFQAPAFALVSQDPALISALAEMRGAINARMDSIDNKINEVSQFAKAAYVKSSTISDFLEKKEANEKRLLKLATGKESVDDWAKDLEKNPMFEGAKGSADTTAQSNPDEVRAPAAGSVSLPR